MRVRWGRSRSVLLAAGALSAVTLVAMGASAAGQPAPRPASTPAAAPSPSTAPSPFSAPGAPPGAHQPRSPATTAPGSPLPDPTAGQSGGREDTPGFLDVGGRVRKAINDWFGDLVTSALDPVLELLGRSVLATPEVTGPGRVRELWAVAAGMANAFFVVLVIVGGAVVMGHETLQSRYSAKEIAPRLVVGAVVANASLALAGLGISLANGFSQAFLGQGVGPADATTTMRLLILAPVASGGIFLILVGLAAAVLGVVLLGVYIVRVAMVVVLVASAPLALACHALPQTEGLAQLWWRAFAACLGVQVAQSLVLVAALRVFFAADGRATLGLSVGGSLVDLLVAICLLWVLLRIPTWAGRAVFSGRGSSTARMLKSYVVVRGAKAALSG